MLRQLSSGSTEATEAKQRATAGKELQAGLSILNVELGFVCNVTVKTVYFELICDNS